MRWFEKEKKKKRKKCAEIERNVNEKKNKIKTYRRELRQRVAVEGCPFAEDGEEVAFALLVREYRGEELRPRARRAAREELYLEAEGEDKCRQAVVNRKHRVGVVA